ncbi:rRNA adenine methyltransferase [Chryseolinea soli]|uniref:rRNA adenine methyltransferase n=2 Tax=Chryseolinea soli TaxID=2321403 RepID=A0A385SEK9_9BACT|nr:rRNA adenine methyltransferase [Chryseolinea soli]
MLYDPQNKTIQRCAQGMTLEGEGRGEVAAVIFRQAWDEATTDLEKFIAAHYVARHQPGVSGKLQWDKTALDHAQRVPDVQVKGAYPSLYLNIAKDYEDLQEFILARDNYETALFYTQFLNDDGYGGMIRAGIAAGIARTTNR